ncbi:methyl-accepting chemotaxis protein [Heliorestis convoluta]|uniref:Methyl-accepting chemotaxis (MCP) signaling domain protein n=1 Tax=Heliorestis convoluta TaxID=356322 RepID=A0A5Q2N369_9FIRM|nr:methyl-accepting chemotaxis protein [Heliorestis convoluta]QGG46770.1 methyl-accepting chemotaxis (MCP) signaling domain protein [Heliorestis convoluta]
MKSIRFKLLIYFGLAIVVVCTALGMLASYTASQALEQKTEEALTQYAKNAADLVGSKIDYHLLAIESVASRDDIRTMNWQEQLEDLKEESDRLGYLTMAVVTPDGVAHYVDGTETYLGDRSYIQKAFAGESNMSDILISRVINAPVIMVAAPIYGEFQEIVGVLIARLAGTSLSHIITDISFGESGYAYMINGEGTMVAHRNEQLVLDQVNYIEEGKSDATLQELSFFMSTMVTEGTVMATYNYEGVVRYASSATVEGTDWYIAVATTQSEVMAAIRDLYRNIFLSSAFVLVIGLALIYGLAQKVIINPLFQLKKELSTLAEKGGDLTQKVETPSNDEIGDLAQAVNSFIEKIHRIVSSVKDSSNLVTASTTEIATAMIHTGQSASQISQSIEEIADGASKQSEEASKIIVMMNQADQGMSLGLHNSKRLVEKATQATSLAEKGEMAINEAISNLNMVEKTVEFATEAIQNLGLRSSEIGEIVTIITNISNQTNLLALNAAIEAARAGEQGKGFAVVSEEVRKLAEESKESAEKISRLIKDIQAETSVTVRSMESNLEVVKKQLHIITQGGDMLKEIVIEVTDTKTDSLRLQDVFSSLNKSFEEVQRAIQEISTLIENTAAASEEVASSAEEQLATVEEVSVHTDEVAKAASKLNEEVGRFKT